MERKSLDEMMLERPEWAVAAIVAEHHEDASDIQSDHYAHKTTERVWLAWSRHKRDLFAEMRKAAATFDETHHLSSGAHLYAPEVVILSATRGGEPVESFRWNGMRYVGQASPWHDSLLPRSPLTTPHEVDVFVEGAPLGDLDLGEDLVATFAWRTRRIAVEHREKYSMGRGYYLKAGSTHDTGWAVRKERIRGTTTE